jgi:hypothetical protein
MDQAINSQQQKFGLGLLFELSVVQEDRIGHGQRAMETFMY